jgi:glutamate-1-semialdehyde aminotransferase
MSTLNAPEEVELAELLIKLHPWAQMVRYARTGGEAMAIAVRIARAATRKDVVLFCGYHGWHDWYLSANLSSDKALDGHLLPGLNPLGVPRKLKGTSLPFNYNDFEGFLKLINRHKNKIGVVVLESIRNHYPQREFINTIRHVTKDLGIVLIVDEITAGFRLNLGGAHLFFNLEPDIAVFAKGISNGFPMSAIIGKKEIMQVAQDSFISSTYWTDRIGPAAALATIKKMKQNNIINHLNNIGEKVQQGWKTLAVKHKINIEISGIAPLGHFVFKHELPLVLKTLFTQLMLERGFLATTGFYACFAHKDRHVQRYLEAVDETFNFIFKAIAEKRPAYYLKGSVCHSSFKRLT